MITYELQRVYFDPITWLLIAGAAGGGMAAGGAFSGGGGGGGSAPKVVIPEPTPAKPAPIQANMDTPQQAKENFLKKKQRSLATMKFDDEPLVTNQTLGV